MAITSDANIPLGSSATALESDCNQSESTESDRIPEASGDLEALRLFHYHLSLLNTESQQQELGEVATTPLFTTPVLEHVKTIDPEDSTEPFPQYGLLAGMTELMLNQAREKEADNESLATSQDPRIFFNISAPSSTFICGSQGSGKSHTLSCLLENCLIPSDANKLPRPLTGLVFHYDAFISDHGGSPCEAAFLASNPAIKVRVLCSPTNVRTIKRAYYGLNVEVEPLIIREDDLNTKRMLDLMAVSRDDGPMPLYLHAIYRILRDMRIKQEGTGKTFSYSEFKHSVMHTAMTPGQLGPLNQRLDMLESFMSKAETGSTGATKSQGPGTKGNNWTPKPGCLTIVDLSCPCVTPEGACSLFNICLSIFLEQDLDPARVVALDEAHKYMNASSEANTLTSTLLSTIRLQRHLGVRVIVSTQEPTISPALLDLSSITIVHRFTSPDWLRTLKEHLAAAASDLVDQNPNSSNILEGSGDEKIESRMGDAAKKIFSEIVRLRAGEALLFSPSAMVDVEKRQGDNKRLKRLGAGYIKIRVRKRLTTDGGKSVMAS